MSTPTIIDLASHGKYNLLEAHLDKEPNSVNEKSWDGRTALHHASYKGRAEICTLLLDRGVNLREVDNVGRNALHYACRKGRRDVCILLLDRHIALEDKDKDDWTALHHACYNGCIEVAKILIDRNCVLYSKEKSGRTALHCAALNGHRAVCELLIKKGANVNAKSNDKATALHYASFNGHRDLCEVLIDNGSDPRSKSLDGQTALHLASRNGHKEVCTLLLDKMKNGGSGGLHKGASSPRRANNFSSPNLSEEEKSISIELLDTDAEGNTVLDCAKTQDLRKYLKAYDKPKPAASPRMASVSESKEGGFNDDEASDVQRHHDSNRKQRVATEPQFLGGALSCSAPAPRVVYDSDDEYDTLDNNAIAAKSTCGLWW